MSKPSKINKPSTLVENSSNKSRYRGVYRCGRGYKAQLQAKGSSYYLGIYETEVDAAKAYDSMARQLNGSQAVTNFNLDGTETQYCVQKQRTYVYYNEDNGDNDITSQLKRIRTDNTSSTTSANSENKNIPIVSNHINILWERLNQISQRLLLSKAAQSKLIQLQSSSPDNEKQNLLRCLNEEVIMLSTVKLQLEEAVSRCFAVGLECLGENGKVMASSASVQQHQDNPILTSGTSTALSSSSGTSNQQSNTLPLRSSVLNMNSTNNSGTSQCVGNHIQYLLQPQSFPNGLPPIQQLPSISKLRESIGNSDSLLSDASALLHLQAHASSLPNTDDSYNLDKSEEGNLHNNHAHSNNSSNSSEEV